MPDPVPTEIKLRSRSRVLSVAFDDGAAFELPFEYLRVHSPSAEVIGFYRDQCARSDAVLAVTPLSAAPRGKHGDPERDQPPTVRWCVLHMIEETARHAGHLDIARELLDGQTRLGPR